MKSVYWIFLFCDAVLPTVIDPPKIASVTTLVPAGFLVKWDSVYEPSLIDGYKIRYWTVKSIEQGYFNLVNGNQIPGLTLHIKPLEPFDAGTTPKDEPQEIVIRDPTAREIEIKQLKYNVLYEIRVLSYKGKDDGPLSGPARIRLIKADDAIVVVAAQRTMNDVCMGTVVTNISSYGDNFYYLRNVYL